jgi:predicted secreted hydrolase
MGGEAGAGYARATRPRPFLFPEDHGPHPEFRTEWWYLTGNLEGPEGEPYGFQFTLFRSAVDPTPPSSSSAWASHQVFMGHFAVTDGRGRTFHAFERFSRQALGLAGATASPLRVWLEDWELRETGGAGGLPPGRDAAASGSGSAAGPGGASDVFPLTLSAAEGEVALKLEISPLKPMVLQGDEGLSQKGAEPGNASYYYSFTRLGARGRLSLGGRERPVTGTAWMDREWSTSALSQGQVGWDWFALQLDDGRELMYYQLRLADGTPDPLSKGVLVGPADTRLLSSSEVELTVLERWTSPLDGTEYPGAWRLRVPDQELELEIRPLIPNQELELTFRYWEGAVVVEGSLAGKAVSGRGYVELTGYASSETTSVSPRTGAGPGKGHTQR